MYWWVAGIVVTLVALQLATLSLQDRYRQFDKAAMAVQSLATAAALLFAGYWFLYERKGQPQANTRLEVVGLKIARDAVSLEARFTLTNLGSTLLEVSEADVRLQQMNADSLPVAELLALDREAFPERIGGKNAYDDGVLMWPTVRWFRGGERRRVEPGETDMRVVDMVASCRDTALRVLFMMRRPGTDHVWSDQATVGLAALCRKRIGSKEVWSNAAKN